MIFLLSIYNNIFVIANEKPLILAAGNAAAHSQLGGSRVGLYRPANDVLPSGGPV